MGYTHNWTTAMPPGETAAFMFHLETTQLANLLPNFETALADNGATILHHRSGQAEGFSLGPSFFDFGESCKTDKGIAEIHIVELLWRTSFAINDAGGDMHITSDCTYGPLVTPGELDTTCAVFLAILMHRCADLVAGRRIEIYAVPCPWPQITSYTDVSVAQQRMLGSSPNDSALGNVLFALDDRNEADCKTTLKPGTPAFTEAVFRHTQAHRYGNNGCLRGLLSHRLQVLVDGKCFAGAVSPHDQHPEVVKRIIDLQPLLPSAQWLEGVVHERIEEALEEA